MKKFRPYWSYDIQKTESWLGEMAEKGWHFTGLKRKRRVFTFEKGEPAKKTYQIGYEKIRPHRLPKTLAKDGWKIKVSTGRWSVLEHGNAEQTPASSVVRDPIVRRNRIHYYGYLAFLIYIIFSTANFLFLTHIVLDAGGEVTREPSPFWAITYTGWALGAAFIVSSVYAIFKIKKTNALLLNNSGSGAVSLSEQNEKKRIRSGDLKAQFKFGWFYKPDKTEQWLENQEASGWHLYRVNRLGNRFYFSKGKPRQVSFKADYQNLSKETYEDMHNDAGWEKVYASRSAMMKWTIWRKEYGLAEQKPELFSDLTEQAGAVRKMALTYTAMFLPMVLMYFFFGLQNILWIDQAHWTQVFQITTFALAAIVFSGLLITVWRSYYRMRRKVNRANV
ncbi:hypothetical protein CR205_02380 [Alteribacter lacisalsi]|uniref:DUF2812 domain-containing protein n=1 Tax=Alteribacter lacisalsi TaxID=2045244 RepID=A0A2W0H6H7_9BACI|nr:DUF2812 domain-containing protein [Alteribacter lacisalsi]PYZ97464.1 hypothetical protein CR205_02380 [Alteribacter lacisalsi]